MCNYAGDIIKIYNHAGVGPSVATNETSGNDLARNAINSSWYVIGFYG